MHSYFFPFVHLACFGCFTFILNIKQQVQLIVCAINTYNDALLFFPYDTVTLASFHSVVNDFFQIFYDPFCVCERYWNMTQLCKLV